MKHWDKINWPALNRRARENEAELCRWPLAQHDLKEKDAAAPLTQADHVITTHALMVWSDDGGSAL